jgi:hypothetical protein
MKREKCATESADKFTKDGTLMRVITIMASLKDLEDNLTR